MEITFVIEGKLPGINEYVDACRSNAFLGNNMKRNSQKYVVYQLLSQLGRGVHLRPPVEIHYSFYEASKRRDHDNVSGFAHKVIQDALVQAGVLTDDGWDEITGYSDHFYVDRNNPRIEVTIAESEKGVNDDGNKNTAGQG